MPHDISWPRVLPLCIYLASPPPGSSSFLGLLESARQIRNLRDAAHHDRRPGRGLRPRSRIIRSAIPHVDRSVIFLSGFAAPERIELVTAMNDFTTDAMLLDRFRQSRDASAFQELVGRYLGMVLGVAQRKTGDAGAAEEIAQNTFSILARKATSLCPEVVLGGWLHRVAALEAADYNRKEYRRRRVMNELKDLTNAAKNLGEPGPIADLLADLDEAMAKLSQRDQDALILRFHAGLRFPEMAQRLGKSEDAVRKQVSRALDKLAGLLGRKRGAALAATDVVAGLQLALTQNAPAPALVQSITAGALSPAPALPVGSAFTLKLFCIMKTQPGVIATSGILLATGSFFAGRHSSAKFSQSLVEGAERNTLLRQEFAVKRLALDQARAPAGRRSVSQIVDDAASSFREASISSAGYYNALLILNELESSDYGDAISYLEEQRNDKGVFESVGALLAGLWAGVNAEAAAGWAEENLDEKRGVAFQNVLTSWSEHDPETAYAWYLNKAESGDSGMSLFSFRWLSKRVFSGWAQKDPEAASAALANVSPEDQAGALYGFADAVVGSIDPEPILAAINEMAESPIRSRLVREVAGAWAKEEPHSAAAWVETLPLESAMARLAAKGEVAEEWMRHRPDDLLEVGAWLLIGAPENMRAEISEMIARQLAKHHEDGGK